eukprot:TRINITY_DN11681_c1_g2_i3.p1 TRINITY_DN11681_c1_g2~~TRINITY_DN11681_c1_g2_i3.p1  ORF type:complete len:365 (+),score=56.96 TRINITY_DN11681_c1_g2_i3:235-1329(+)
MPTESATNYLFAAQPISQQEGTDISLTTDLDYIDFDSLLSLEDLQIVNSVIDNNATYLQTAETHVSSATAPAMTAPPAPTTYPDMATTASFGEHFDKITAIEATCSSSTSTNTNDIILAEVFGTNFDPNANDVPSNSYGHDSTIDTSFSSDSICRHGNAETHNSTNFLETFDNHTLNGSTATVTNLNTGEQVLELSVPVVNQSESTISHHWNANNLQNSNTSQELVLQYPASSGLGCLEGCTSSESVESPASSSSLSLESPFSSLAQMESPAPCPSTSAGICRGARSRRPTIGGRVRKTNKENCQKYQQKKKAEKKKLKDEFEKETTKNKELKKCLSKQQKELECLQKVVNALLSVRCFPQCTN